MMKFKLGLIAAMTAAITGTALISPMVVGDDREEATLALHAISKSGITVDKAFDIAQQSVQGVVYKYELDDNDNGDLFHELEIVDLEQQIHHKIKIAVLDGAVDSKEKSYNCSSLKCKHDFVREAQAIQESGVSLGDAIAQLKLSGVQLLEEADVELERGVRYYKLEVIDADGERDILVDLDTGKVIPALTRSR